MSKTECRCCHRPADIRSFRTCCSCGAPLCDDCASRTGGLCEDCGEDEYRR